MAYASRAGDKLEAALQKFEVPVTGCVCADFGSSTGGFVDCLLQFGAKKVYAVETGYGVLDWKLRSNPQVVVMERKNAMHVELLEKVDLITIDTSWSKLDHIIPNALRNLKDNGRIIALVKPHYEAEQSMLRKGTLPEEHISEVVDAVKEKLRGVGVVILNEIESPILGGKGKNKEFLFLLERSPE